MSEQPKRLLQGMDRGFIESGAAGVTPEQVERVAQSGKAVDVKFASRMLVRFANDAKLTVLLVRDYVAGRYREVPWWAISAMVFSLLYVLSPLDLIPDFIPVIGLMDDAAVFMICVGMVEHDLQRYAEWRARAAAAGSDKAAVGQGGGI